MNESKIRQISKIFRLGKSVSVQDAGGSRNKSFVFSTTDGKWVVRKRYIGYADEARIRFDHESMLHLAAMDVPVIVPRVTIYGATWWADNGDTWEVYPFIAGTHMRDGDPEDMAALGRALAAFHLAGHQYPLRYEKGGMRGETDPDALSATAEKLTKECPEISGDVSKYQGYLRWAASRLSIDAYMHLPHTLIHGDVQPANVLMRSGSVAAFVDLDWCAWRPRLYDLSFALLCCAAHDEPIGEGNIWQITQMPRIDAEAVRTFISQYEQNSWPLSEDELQALGPQLALSWCSMRLDGAGKVGGEDLHSFLDRKNDEDIHSVISIVSHCATG